MTDHELTAASAPVTGAPIVLVNQSKKVSPMDLSHWATALQIQVSQHFAPIWHTDARVYIDNRAPHNAWPFTLVDYPDPAIDPDGALGYHDLGPDGRPYARIFVGTAIDNQVPPSSVLSHELLETLADPLVYSTVPDDPVGDGKQFDLYMLEVCDAPERENYPIGGVPVSNFVTRTWFGRNLPAPWDYLKHIPGPFRLLSGGYIGVNRAQGSGWGQETASLAAQVVMAQGAARKGPLPQHVFWLPGKEED